MTKYPRLTLTRRQVFGLLGLGGAATVAAAHSSSVAAAEPTHELQSPSPVGSVYLFNVTPYTVRFTVNNGTLRALAPFRGPSGGTGNMGALSAMAFGVPRSASPDSDVFAGSSSGGFENSLFVSTPGGGPDLFYEISVTTPLPNNLYIWLFVGQVIAVDQGGSSQGIQVKRTT